MNMEYNRQLCVAMTFVGAILVVVASAGIHTDSDAYAQVPYNGSSSSTSTVCVNNQSCHTITCNNNQPCHAYTSPNIESPYDDNLDDIEDMFDYDYD
jgi:hypothetical protein